MAPFTKRLPSAPCRRRRTRGRPGTLHRSSCSAPRMRLTSPPLRSCGSRESVTRRCAPPSRSALGPTSLQMAVQEIYLGSVWRPVEGHTCDVVLMLTSVLWMLCSCRQPSLGWRLGTLAQGYAHSCAVASAAGGAAAAEAEGGGGGSGRCQQARRAGGRVPRRRCPGAASQTCRRPTARCS